MDNFLGKFVTKIANTDGRQPLECRTTASRLHLPFTWTHPSTLGSCDRSGEWRDYALGDPITRNGSISFVLIGRA